MPETTQLNVAVTENQRKLVDIIAEERGWTVTETIRTAIEELVRLRIVHKGTAAKLATERGPELGKLWTRLVEEFGATGMVNKRIQVAEMSDGKEGLLIDGEYVFTLEDDGRVLATKQGDDVSEVYEVKDGKLALGHVFSPGFVTLN